MPSWRSTVFITLLVVAVVVAVPAALILTFVRVPKSLEEYILEICSDPTLLIDFIHKNPHLVAEFIKSNPTLVTEFLTRHMDVVQPLIVDNLLQLLEKDPELLLQKEEIREVLLNNDVIRRMVEERYSLDPTLLRELLTDNWQAVRQTLAANPSILRTLVRDNADLVLDSARFDTADGSAALQEFLDADVVVDALRDDATRVTALVAANPEIIQRYIQEDPARLAAFVANNPQAVLDAVESNPSAFATAVADNPRVVQEAIRQDATLLERIVANNRTRVDRILAGSPIV
jgi:hypothetical protein